MVRTADPTELSPVRHGYVERPEDWAWSSFHRHVRLVLERSEGMGWLDPNLSLSVAKEWPGSSPVELPAIEEQIGCASQW